MYTSEYIHEHKPECIKSKLSPMDFEPPERYKYDFGFKLGLKYGLKLKPVPIEYITPICREYRPTFAEGYEVGVRRRVVILSRD